MHVCVLCRKSLTPHSALFQGRSARTSTCPFSRWSRCKSSLWTKQCCWHANRPPKKSSSPTSSGPTRAARPSNRTSECAAGCRPKSMGRPRPLDWLITLYLGLFLSHWLITTVRHEILQPPAHRRGWFCIPEISDHDNQFKLSHPHHAAVNINFVGWFDWLIDCLLCSLSALSINTPAGLSAAFGAFYTFRPTSSFAQVYFEFSLSYTYIFVVMIFVPTCDYMTLLLYLLPPLKVKEPTPGKANHSPDVFRPVSGVLRLDFWIFSCF